MYLGILIGMTIYGLILWISNLENINQGTVICRMIGAGLTFIGIGGIIGSIIEVLV